MNKFALILVAPLIFGACDLKEFEKSKSVEKKITAVDMSLSEVAELEKLGDLDFNTSCYDKYDDKGKATRTCKYTTRLRMKIDDETLYVSFEEDSWTESMKRTLVRARLVKAAVEASMAKPEPAKDK